ncbi:PIG-L deacetylase family protein [Polynucleobacter sp. AM-7D1]|uniref:PIG-L deacetylase family protein n=1 Tax=Polynucleobacter sp. AM-7D1 TaxID=2689102 RepID=UPI001BFE9ECE|nr:PIG-L family deacetylase [Polynucleobacter sp. AM-7D1]QWE28987.1 PIG-L family deacetylase [Polynucleobacter sp. AM-7D1]
MTAKDCQIVLVIIAHRDDETIGLAGVIARHIECGDFVYAMSMTDGVGARGSNISEVRLREQASLKVANALGFSWLDGGSFPDNAIDTVPLLEIVKVIEAIKIKINPTIIYTHSSADLNIDHRIVGQATLTAFRPQPDERWQEIRLFEVSSATDYGHRSVTGIFNPNLYINIENVWNKKLLALNIYNSEMRSSPHSRSYDGIENLAKYRGSQVGLNFAEAFEVIRKIER